MIETILDIKKEQCTGCGACYNKCPTNAIKMQYDNEGFLYPHIDKEACIDCGLCYNICPSVNKAVLHESTPECYAVMASEDIRMKSSSGGMFTLLANYMLKKGGYICGAVYSKDYTRVEHIIVSDKDGIAKLRGSKYVQSDTGRTFSEIKTLLDSDKYVLFSGCPCQVAGLKNFLGKDYNKLLTVDLVCHGANSLTAYQSFIKECAKDRQIESVNFREKEVYGWSTPVTIKYTDNTITRQAWDKSPWYKGFLNGIINRPYCSHCEYATSKRIGDITLGDFWGIHKYNPNWNDWKGTSLVLVNTSKGKDIFEKTKSNMILCETAPLEFAQQNNGQLIRPLKAHAGRRFFFHHLNSDGYHKSLWYGQKYRYDVGLVGWWFASNYGSALTYYALGKILEDMDMLAIMVQIPKLNGTPWEPETKKTIDFISKYFPITKYRPVEQLKECNRFCDMFMLGSDQLWTKSAIDMLGYTFFLDFVDKDKKKLAFATSFGHEQFEGTKAQKQHASLLLKSFDYISVRENSGINLSKDNFDIDVKRDLDPVFICDKRHFDALAETSAANETEDYLFCYILDPTEEKQSAIQYAAHKLHLKIIAVLDMKTGERRKGEWHTGELKENASVEDFLYYIKHCKFLVTDSHHGVCFGMIYEKNFISIANHARGLTRFTHLLGMFELSNKLVYEPKQIKKDDTLFEEIDYKNVNQILMKEKNTSLERFTNALNAEKVIDYNNFDSINLRITELENTVNKLQQDIADLKSTKSTNNKILQALKELKK